MLNLSDKEIDRLSREAADSYEPDTNFLSWTRLEQKLVEQMPERPPDGFQFGRISPYVWGPAVMLLAGVSYFFIKTNFYSRLSTRSTAPVSQINKLQTTDSKRSDLKVKSADSLSSVQNPTSSGTDHSKGLGQTEVTALSSGPANNKKSESDGHLLDAQQTHAHPTGQKPPSTNVAGTHTAGSGKKITPGLSVSSNTGNTLAFGIESSASAVASAGGLVSGPPSAAIANAENSSSVHQTSRYNLPLIITSGTSLGTVRGNDSLLNRLAAGKSPVRQKSVHINRSLSIGFTFGTDYTDAGGISNNQLSNNIGITLGYYLTNKLSINTGLIYSNKFYWAPGDGHGRTNSQPYGRSNTYTWAPDIEYINGSCNMYELPLTLRYDFARNEKTKFFINAGASSYFLLKQTNIYFTHNGNGRPVAWLSKDESPSNYWFGVGDISFGLETDIGKGFSFQAEPFFRIPLQKMGVENLKMYSYGFMISFRYAPVLSRTRK